SCSFVIQFIFLDLTHLVLPLFHSYQAMHVQYQGSHTVALFQYFCLHNVSSSIGFSFFVSTVSSLISISDCSGAFEDVKI
ncbi:hypothetical protein IKN40_05005, partial [bacterium]|nr:hypothetical protein [bacterium]